MSSTTSPSDDAAIAGFWRVVAREGWHGVTMRAIAAEAGLPTAGLRERFGSPQSILLAHGRAVDAEVVAGTVDDPTSSPRDRLFDVLMRRIDALAPHRAGVVRLWDDLPRTPLLGLWLAGQLPVSMAWMLEAAGLSPAGVKGALRVQGLGLVWLATLRAWAEDDSADLSATMAALDRALDQADRAARWLSLGAEETAAAPDATEAGMAAAGVAPGLDPSPAGEALDAKPLAEESVLGDVMPESAAPGDATLRDVVAGDAASAEAPLSGSREDGLPEDQGRAPKGDGAI